LVSFGGGEQLGAEAAEAFGAVPALVQAGDDWAAERARKGLPPLGVAVAITHGEVVHGVIGHDERREFTVIGDAVNLAAKLEKHAKLEQARVIATKCAFAKAVEQGGRPSRLRDAAGAMVEGVAAPVDLVVVA
jgi:adenylate cyclase